MTTNRMAGLFEAADLPYTDHREYLWSTELSKDKPKAEWNFKEEDEDRDFLSHILYLKSAVLGTSAETGEDNVIEVETLDYSGSVLKVPIAFLNKGQKNMCQIDHSFDQSTPATFRLISGKGPVFLTAQHQVEFPQEEEEEDSDEYGDHGTQSEEEVSREEEEEENGDAGGKALKARKRKATTPASGKEKRGKLDSKSIENQDESMEASTNGTESDEDDEDFEEEEEEEEEESEEEDEESPEKSKKSKKKKGATNGKAATKKVAQAKSKPAPAKKAKGKKAK